jgi:tetratricopeptide (TPR) repeat protein
MARALALLLLLVGAADAQALRSLAREKFDEGRRQFAAADYPGALQLFKESYQLAPHPDLLFNIGRCQEQMGHYREALDAYQRYLAVNPGDDEAQRHAAEMRARASEEPPPPPPVEPSPSPTPSPLVSQPPLPRALPVYKRWWLWTVVVGVAGVALGVGLGVGLSGADPQRTFPPLGAR